MNKTFKKVLSVVLALVMVVTSITVYNTTAKADGAIALGTPVDNNDGTFTVAITKTDEVVYTQIYLKTEDGELHNAKSSDGSWVWNTAPEYQPYNNANQVMGSDDGVVKVADGGTFTLVVKGYSSKEVQDESTLLGEAETSITMEPYVNENMNLNLTVTNKDLGAVTGNGPTFNWELVNGAVQYKVDALRVDGTSAKNWTLGENVKTLFYWGSDVAAETVGADTYTLRVQALSSDGTVIVEESIEEVPAYSPVNKDAALSVTYETGTAILSWKAITNAVSYVVSVDGTETTVTDTKMEVAVEEGTVYNVSVKALDENGTAIDIINNTLEVQYVAEAAPEENDISKVDTSSWTVLNVNAGTSENAYFINSAHGLSTGVWWGIYAPHSAAAYHGDRTNCILGDAAAFVFQQSDVKEIWVNGNKYGNPSTAFNNQGDCAEISVDVLTEKQNVITLVLNNNTMKTFAIKVAEPMGPDATESASQTVINPDSIEDWVALAGPSTNGSTAYISSAAGDNMGNGALRGFYAAGQSTNWNISDAMRTVPVFGFVATNDNASSIIIDGVEYVNAKDARNTKVFIGADCVYINDSLLEAPTGETVYHTITAVGSKVDTFVVKVVGAQEVVEAPATPTGVNVTHSWDNGGFIVIAFDAASATDGAKYEVYIDAVDADEKMVGTIEANGATLADSVTGVVPNTGYWIRLRAVKNDVYSDYSEQYILNFEEQKAQYTVTIDGEEVAQVEEGAAYTLGDAEYGYLCDGKMYAPNTAVTVTKDMTFTSVNELSVTMANGAGIRYAGTAGIRFQASIASDNMDAVASEAITEGTLITAKDINDAFEEELTLTYSHAKIDVKNSGWFNGQTGTYCGSICDVVESNYIREFTARAYVTVNYENADAVTIYSNMGPARSISQVATAVKNAGYPGIPTESQSIIDSFIK